MIGTCVVYLVWGPLGAGPVERFAGSYRSHPAEQEHSLVLLLNGVEGELRQRCAELAGELGAEIMELPERVIDLDAYRGAAERVDADTLLFLNTYSEILADAWLKFLQAALMTDSVGMVAATGSFESALSAAPRPLRPILRHSFPPFPNPHLRTNAFMLERQLMLDLDWVASPNKRRALALESGKRGVTRQILERGLEALVIDNRGRCYSPEEWPESRTFRSGEQENLLVADNRTREYASATPARRAELFRYAWGSRQAATILPGGATFGPTTRSS